MHRPRIRERRLLRVVLAVVLLISLPGAVAAKDPSNGRGHGAPTGQIDAVEVAPTGSGEAVAQAVTYEYNPWGCRTETQNPHQSGHYPGTVAAVANHICTGYRGGNRSISTYPTSHDVRAYLYYESCFFFYCSWNQVDTDYVMGTNLNPTIGRTLSANCHNSNSTRWRIVANGSSTGFNGTQVTTYYSTSETIVTLACGR